MSRKVRNNLHLARGCCEALKGWQTTQLPDNIVALFGLAATRQQHHDDKKFEQSWTAAENSFSWLGLKIGERLLLIHKRSQNTKLHDNIRRRIKTSSLMADSLTNAALVAGQSSLIAIVHSSSFLFRLQVKSFLCLLEERWRQERGCRWILMASIKVSPPPSDHVNRYQKRRLCVSCSR